MWTDLRYALRQLVRSPGFTAVAVISLALGIGANAAIFSLFEQVLLRPIPVHEPGRLVNVSAPGMRAGTVAWGQAGTEDDLFSYPMFRALESGQQVLGLAAHKEFAATVATGEQSFPASGLFVSGSYFPVVGVRPVLGRLLGDQDDTAPGADPVAVLSHRFWDARLGGDPAVVGRSIQVNGRLFTVVGVAPPGFDGVTLGNLTDVFVPLTMREEILSLYASAFDNWIDYWAFLFGRLGPGVSVEQAEAALNRLHAPLVQEMDGRLIRGLTDEQMASFTGRRIVLEDGRRGQSTFHGEARLPLLLLLVVTGIVLLITCANLANLLLARGARRVQELAIRASLGASRSRLLAQLLTEAVVLALLGAAVGLVIAFWTLSFTGSFLPHQTAAVLDLSLQPAMLGWAGLLALGTALLFGLYPAIQATRPGLVTALRSVAGQPSGGRSAARFRSGLVTAQIALSVALLISAGLFVRSLLELSRVDLGLQTENLVAFDLRPNLVGYDATASHALYERVGEELSAIPGVVAVTSAQVGVLRGNFSAAGVLVEGRDFMPGGQNWAGRNRIGTDYFRTLGIPLLAGREFSAADTRGSQRVAIVNEEFARVFGLDPEQVVGKRMETHHGGELGIEIVGLVRDAHFQGVKEPPPATFYLPWRQEEAGGMTFYARTAVDPQTVTAMVPALVGRLDSNVPLQNLITMDRQVKENVFLDRTISGLTATFAALATLLAAVGLFGVMAYTVAQRTREIGLRMALGAEAGRIRRLIMGQVGRMLVVGIAIGVAAALALGRVVRSLLFEIDGHDPVVVVGGAALLAVVALAAGYLPALRASRVDPMVALREE